MGQKKVKRILFTFMFMCFIPMAVASTAHANAAEPPILTIIVSFPPDDLVLSILFTDGSKEKAIRLAKERKAWETYYRFFYSDASGKSLEGAVLIAQSREKTIKILLPSSAFDQYNSLLTLNIEEENILVGQTFARSFLLISMRMVVTLLIEGAVFFAFGYRNKRSWFVFLTANLITQGALTIAINGPNLGSYWFYGLIFYEIMICVTEMLIFTFLLREHRKGQAIACVFLANLSSLFLGGIWISYLPV